MGLIPIFWFVDSFIIWFSLDTTVPHAHLWWTVPVTLVISGIVHWLWMQGKIGLAPPSAANATPHEGEVKK